MIPKLWIYVIGLALAIAMPVGAYYAGKYVQRDADADAQLALDNAAALKDAARVKDIDLGTGKIDITYHAVIAYQTAVQSRNVEDQTHAIDADPSLLACALPADVVRLRREQFEASQAPAAARP